MRSKTKGPYVGEIKVRNGKKYIKRNATIVPSMDKQEYYVHLGNRYEQIKISSDQIGQKIGEFIKTK